MGILSEYWEYANKVAQRRALDHRTVFRARSLAKGQLRTGASVNTGWSPADSFLPPGTPPREYRLRAGAPFRES